MSVRICACSDRRMARRRQQVGVAVIAIRKVRPMVKKQPEAMRFEVSAITLQIILPKLVNDQNDHQLGMSIICACISIGGKSGSNGNHQDEREKTLEHRHKIQTSW